MKTTAASFQLVKMKRVKNAGTGFPHTSRREQDYWRRFPICVFEGNETNAAGFPHGTLKRVATDFQLLNYTTTYFQLMKLKRVKTSTEGFQQVN